MDSAKKQKVMIAVLVVCALGAGGVWYMNSDSSGPTATSAPSAVTKTSRKDGAEEAKTVKKTSSRDEAPAEQDEATGPVKKKQTREDTASAPKKESRDKTPPKKKDKKQMPAV